MKRILFLTYLLFLMACGSGVNSHKAAIHDLTTKWEKTTNALTDLSNALTQDMNLYTENALKYQLDDAVEDALDGDKAIKWQDAKRIFKMNTSDAYTPIQSELSSFINMWVENSAKIVSLNEGLEAGKLAADVNEQIADLTSLIAQANEKITEWNAKKIELNAAANTGLESLKTAYESLTM
ncbi:MAG: hypothetical protein LC107_02065 [Chitinophagales bacterium]|nr:hypothetical protein [Chitinophagales bacterium]